MAEEIICLGKKFNSEEERREYFRNQLREKLSELKNIDGYPIGEDEDIISLSDPPYYTACPNPWLNEFINEWEEEKEQIQVREKSFHVDEPYFYDVSEGKYDPMYLYHPYPTKVPHKAIMKFILHFTQPGDIIFDGFAGTGMTGVASRLCENPPYDTKYKIEREFNLLGLEIPRWGARKAICSDLSPLANYIAFNYNNTISFDLFERSASQMLASVESECKWMFETNHSHGKKGIINYVVWSDIFVCPICHEEIVFWDSAVDKENGKVLDDFFCPSCKRSSTKKNLEKLFITSYDTVLQKTIRQPKTKPVLINYSFAGKRYQKNPDEEDFQLINKIESIAINEWFPKEEIPYGDKTTEAIRIGITHVHHFYTKRNLIALAKIRAKFNDPVFNILVTKVAFQTTKLYRLTYQNGVWGAGGGPLSGTLYIPSLIKELNIIKQLQDAIKGRSKIAPASRNSNVIINSSSANYLNHIKENSVDYIFTDPPFGANLMYSELNFLSESWLKVKTNNKNEAIENKSQGKSLLSYQALITECFQQYYRILKPNHWMSVEFSNTSAAVWNSIHIALQRVGFIISNIAGLDKLKGSYNAVNSPTAVKQDLVISCYKPSSSLIKNLGNSSTETTLWQFINEHLSHLPVHIAIDRNTSSIIERSPKILYDRFITYYLMKGYLIPMDAREFQEVLKQRFYERDGMYFTQEQVNIYDEKKAQTPSVVQISWQIGTESEGIEWLKRELKNNSLKYQDIQPKWMQAITAVRKGDILPELRDILQQNFIEENDGKWRVPDMNETKDREILRNKALMKEFNSYADLANNPKSKRLKEVRVEALRAGFKYCWDTKNFQIIVQISDKIPQNLLLEDEQLLMYYDIAKDRV